MGSVIRYYFNIRQDYRMKKIYLPFLVAVSLIAGGRKGKSIISFLRNGV